MIAIKNFISKRDALTIFAILILGSILFFSKTGLPTSSKNTETKVLSARAEDIQSVYDSCKELTGKEQCYGKAFANLTKQTDMKYAFLVLRELQKKDTEARGCHFIAHSISIAETEKDPSKWKDVMNIAPQDCSYGAAHGALEAYSATKSDGRLSEEEVLTVCNNPDTNNCTHILGHLLLVMNYDDISKSTLGCNGLPHNDRAKFECLTGVFMERITGINLETHGLATKEALNWSARVPELEKLCRMQTGTESIACWKEIVHAVLIKVGNNPQKLVNFCETAPRDIETKECIDHALGILASVDNFVLKQMHHICEVEVKDSTFKNRCYAGLVGATISTIPAQIPDAVAFCSSIPSPYQKDCFTILGNSLYQSTPELKSLVSKECELAPDEFREACSSGGNTQTKFNRGN